MTVAVVLAATFALIAGGAVCAAAIHQLTIDDYWLGALAFNGFTAVGLLVVYRRSRETMGWLLVGVGVAWNLAISGGFYATLDYSHHHGRMPLGWLAVLCTPGWATAFFLLALAVVLFPDGRPPSSRWRWPLRISFGVAALWVVTTLVFLIPALVTGTVRLDSNGNIVRPRNTLAAGLSGITLALLGLACVLMITVWLLSQFVSYRTLRGERRMQQKWILAGIVTSFVMTLISLALGSSWVANFTSLGLVAMPVSIGVAILRYRLYDIDRVISRTLSYAIVTATLAGVFVALVGLTTQLLPFSSSVGVAASTLAAAALFNPLRKRVQHGVDGRFNRSRYDAGATVAAFAERLRDAVDLDGMQLDLIDVVRSAVHPEHVSVWLRDPRSIFGKG